MVEETLLSFLTLEPDLQRLFILGRHLGILVRLEDMEIPARRTHVEAVGRRVGQPGKISTRLFANWLIASSEEATARADGIRGHRG
jgi:hypothetical protein